MAFHQNRSDQLVLTYLTTSIVKITGLLLSPNHFLHIAKKYLVKFLLLTHCVHLELLKYSIFLSFYSDDSDFILHDDEFCAGLPHNSVQKRNQRNNLVTSPGKDACQGDSGGPFICPIDDEAVLVGVVSYGSGCGAAGKPGIYAKVDYFMEWFKSILSEPSVVLLTNPFQQYYAIEFNFVENSMQSLEFTFEEGTKATGACSTVFKGETLIIRGQKGQTFQVRFEIFLQIF